MRVIFDENMPLGLDSDFVGHECKHVISLGWAGVQNGALLTLAENAGFQVLLTFDKGLPVQQNLTGRRISICILKPNGQGLGAMRALIPKIILELSTLEEGVVRIISDR